VHARVLKPWRGSLPWLLAISSFCPVTSFHLPCLGSTDAHCPCLGDPVPLPPKWRPSSQDPRTLPHRGPIHLLSLVSPYRCFHTDMSSHMNGHTKYSYKHSSWSAYIHVSLCMLIRVYVHMRNREIPPPPPQEWPSKWHFSTNLKSRQQSLLERKSSVNEQVRFWILDQSEPRVLVFFFGLHCYPNPTYIIPIALVLLPN
jgi:hypothetical protein